ncbi:hypothetical protein PILCRDRAFT_84488 [Piloderma croceum F 1598]|uniref:Probable 26S proteasome regulatory subunit p27 n=1 Tax=Piloderma croceum (strain F 1598) TaxID=765440 RepID=A0A0C3GFQ3_PILCF|nr:hypothetical protein PILCRDRAFT_84488 [Piloderma croceum F 1598]
MGFILPAPYSPKEQARTLIARKDGIEAEIDTQLSILRANNATLQSPLVDNQGFPRDDLDIYQVRNARVRIIELRNDLKDVTNDIAKALETIYDPSSAPASASSSTNAPINVEEDTTQPFARVDGIAPGSPAAEAGMQREDLVVKFGHLTSQSFSSSSLQILAELVAVSENRELPIKIVRADQTISMKLTPRKGWGGRGMLGCHIVPYTPP